LKHLSTLYVAVYGGFGSLWLSVASGKDCKGGLEGDILYLVRIRQFVTIFTHEDVCGCDWVKYAGLVRFMGA
jgi:hypothetical protein